MFDLIRKIRRALLVRQLAGLNEESADLDYYERLLERRRAQIARKFARTRAKLLDLDTPVAVDGCDPF